MSLVPAQAAYRYWVGQGQTQDASEGANWQAGRAPKDGDRVVFGSTSGKDCRWDLDVALSSMTLTQAYGGAVRLGRSNLGVRLHVRVAGGTLDLEEGALTVGRRVYLDHGGALQLSQGTLRLGPLGLLVDDGGSLLSTGDRPARITSAEAGRHYPFVVGDGTIKLSNPAGTEVERSQGLVIYSAAKLEQADFVKVTEVEQGKPGLDIVAARGKKLDLKGWSFDESVQEKVAAKLSRNASLRLETETAQGKEVWERASGKAANISVLPKPAPPAISEAQAPPQPGEVKAPAQPALAWTGALDDKASNGANWSLGRPPAEGDWIVFDGNSGRDCDWDLPARVVGWSQEAAYGGTVGLGTQALTVMGDLQVLGGKLDLDSGDLTLSGDAKVAQAGVLELNSGTLRLGTSGLMVEDGGTLISTGDEPALVLPSVQGKTYPVTVSAGGKLRLANPSGTVFQGTQGLDLKEDAKVEQADFAHFSSIEPGKAAVTIESKAPVSLTLTGWKFDSSVAVNADASGLASGSKLHFMDAAGEHAGPGYAKDPGGAIAWEKEVPFAASAKYKKEAFKYTPYVAAQFLMGQYFFAGDEGNLSGNANILASSVLQHDKLGPKWSVIPMASLRYQGTKQVTDLVGGGTLFQEVMDSRLAVRGVYQASKLWKIKPEIGYSWQFLKETKDERWSKGLFDNERLNLSVEGEYLYRDPFSLRVGYDYYRIRFPNYTSLESQAQGRPGEKLARELAGSAVLDSENHALSLGGNREAPWRSFLEGTYVATYRSFPRQHVVTRTGDFSRSTREDFVHNLNLAWRFPREVGRWKTVVGFVPGFARCDSNQNNYDAQRTKYLGDYYDSTMFRGGLDVAARRSLGKDRTLVVRASASLARVRYPGRLVQDESGLYKTGRIVQPMTLFNLQVGYPIAPHFLWTLQVGGGKQASNQMFEKLYRYNFSATNYLLGFSYEY